MISFLCTGDGNDEKFERDVKIKEINKICFYCCYVILFVEVVLYEEMEEVLKNIIIWKQDTKCEEDWIIDKVSYQIKK